MSRALERESNGEARVIPIILRPCDWQDAPFGHLQALPTDGNPVTTWQHADEAFTSIAAAIRAVVQAWRETFSLPPTPFLETGAMPIDSPFYVERAADSYIAHLLTQPGQTIIIKGSRQSGKSSLLNRLHVNDDSIASCFLDLQAFSPDAMQDSDRLFQRLAHTMAEEFAIDIQVRTIWRPDDDPQQNLTRFVEELLITLATQGKMVRFLLDEADRVFAFAPTRDSLFSLLRSWHNRRARPTRPYWRHLDLVIAHATEPALWLPDPYQSPFNVGMQVRLDDFDTNQIYDLSRRYPSTPPSLQRAELDRLVDLIGGHPFLVRAAFHAMAEQQLAVAELERIATEAQGPFSSHLHYCLWVVLEHVDIKEALRQVMNHGVCENEMHYQRLWAAGLISGDRRSQVSMRCKLYHDYFQDRL